MRRTHGGHVPLCIARIPTLCYIGNMGNGHTDPHQREDTGHGTHPQIPQQR